MTAKFNIEDTLNYKAGVLHNLSSNVSRKMETLRKRLSEKNYQLINSLGELQALGSKIDIFCAEVNLLNRIQQGKE